MGSIHFDLELPRPFRDSNDSVSFAAWTVSSITFVWHRPSNMSAAICNCTASNLLKSDASPWRKKDLHT